MASRSGQSDSLRVDAVCEACGGYGVTVYPRSDGRTKAKCGGCNGQGHFRKDPPRLWSEWTPDPNVLKMLAETPEHQGEDW